MAECTIEIKALSGNLAAAQAAKLARVQGGFFFPIGPADEVMEEIVKFADAGELPGTQVIQLQNERGCVVAQLEACRSGLRTMFATSHDGVMWATEQLMYSAAHRVPIMVILSSRSISVPGPAIGPDYYDFIMMREYGGLMFYCESPQDILDTTLQAYRVAEDRSVSLPVILGYEGWEISHGSMRCVVPDQAAVDRFLPSYSISPENDILAVDCWQLFQTRWMRDMHAPWYSENKYKLYHAKTEAKRLIQEVGAEYSALFGSSHVGLVESYQTSDAEVVLVTMGAITSAARLVVDMIRAEGKRIGLLKIRAFRPFPDEALLEHCRSARVVVVLERDPTDALFREVEAGLFPAEPHPLVLGRVVGLCGKEVTLQDVARIALEGFEVARTGACRKRFEYAQIGDTDNVAD